MNLIVETDIGHDPDDFFALCYLISAGVNIRAILISPGDPDQIAVTKFLLEQVGLDIPVGTSHTNRDKLSSGSIHHQLLKKYGKSLYSKSDGAGTNIIASTLKSFPDCEAFIIGPVSSIGEYLKTHPLRFSRATMQGGFLGYDLHAFPCKRLAKFEGTNWQPTFNLNGDRDGADWFLKAYIQDRRFVGKNVCHTIIYDAKIHEGIKPKDRASELFKEGMDMYLAKHGEKKFHDPSAACCHLHPEIGSWVRGYVHRIQSGWGTEISFTGNDGDYILADIDYDKLWYHMLNFI